MLAFRSWVYKPPPSNLQNAEVVQFAERLIHADGKRFLSNTCRTSGYLIWSFIILTDVWSSIRKELSMRSTKPGRTFTFDFRMMTILLLIAAVPFLLGAWWLVNSYRNSAIEAHGYSLAEEADVAFDYLNNFLGNQIVEIAGLTEVPVLRDAIEKNNLQLKTNLNEASRETAAIESRWKSLNYTSPELRAVLDNPAAGFLQRYIKTRSSYREIIVTDLVGRTVAATGKTSDYRHAKDLWWKTAYADGEKGGVYIGDVHYHESAKVYCIDIAQPIVDLKGGVMGVIMVGISADEIHSLIASLQSGVGGTATLMRFDGSVISAPGYSPTDSRPFPGVRDIIKAREFGKRYVVTQTSPATILGINSRSFMDVSPNLHWLLAISSPVNSVVGSFTQLLRNLILLMMAIFLLAILVAFLLSCTETRKILQEDAHLENL